MSYAAEPLKIAYLITYINRHNKSDGRQPTENESRHRTAHGGVQSAFVGLHRANYNLLIWQHNCTQKTRCTCSSQIIIWRRSTIMKSSFTQELCYWSAYHLREHWVHTPVCSLTISSPQEMNYLENKNFIPSKCSRWRNKSMRVLGGLNQVQRSMVTCVTCDLKRALIHFLNIAKKKKTSPIC